MPSPEPVLSSWPELRALALSLDLPGVIETTAWDHPVLKAHGKMWTWWSPKIDAAVFKADRDEVEMLHAADPATFLLHPHYAGHGLLLVAQGRIDPGWARARLISTWRSMAPKRLLKAWEAGQG
ncbi:MAG: MmcQ/YjbR family DNA-binding protein [Rhodobacteraceae bacterium]|nr:MmcQ/YjbR family DNA-binding protein [Paracoccaceae bacterium]